MRRLPLLLVLLSLAAQAQDVDSAEEAAPGVTSETGASRSGARLHVSAGALVDVPARAVGLEVGATATALPVLDLGLGLSIGSSVGLLALAELHTAGPLAWGVRPFGQLRFAAHFASGGYGGGLWAGATLELGPGRLKAGPAVELFAPRPGFRPWAVLLLGAYELDLLRPAPAELAERGAGQAREEAARAERQPPPPPSQPTHPPGATVLTGRLGSADGRPLKGTITLHANGQTHTIEASPDFDIELPPGEWLVEVVSDGALAQARRVDLEPDATLTADFTLRPEPRTRSAELRQGEIALRQPLRFEAGRATLLPQTAPMLDEVADVLLRHPQIKQLRIEGHTDDPGGPEENQALSEERALAVTEQLIARGVEPQRLQAQGFGSSRPVVSGRSETARARNRRVLLKIIE